MRLQVRLPLLLILHVCTNIISTSPVSLKAEPQYANLLDRAACAIYCGFSSQLCCSAGYACYTDQSNQAQCSPSVYNPTPATAAGFAATATTTIICNGNHGQTACGDTCCGAGQTCLSLGQCSGATPASAAPTTATVTSVSATVVGVSTPATVTTTAAVATVTSSSSTTTTVSTGLDSGSIAGIVIGVIVGIIVLVWMCKPLTNRTSTEKISSISSRSSRGHGSRRSRR